jgi:hypothetical protein
MAFSITLFIASWICFLIFADKKKLFDFMPTCYIAMILGFTTDLLIHHYPLWDYPAATKMHSFGRHMLDEFGVYFVVSYLFLQTLPKKQTILAVSRHIFYWTLLAVILEWIALITGSMKHGLWWNLWCSFIADLFLFVLFYSHHKWREYLKEKEAANLIAMC